jgi:hypothetical protein
MAVIVNVGPSPWLHAPAHRALAHSSGISLASTASCEWQSKQARLAPLRQA